MVLHSMCAVLPRMYTRAFGYRIGGLLPRLCSHITGLREPKEPSAASWLHRVCAIPIIQAVLLVDIFTIHRYRIEI